MIAQEAELVFRLMKLTDIPDILIIEREAFTMPWTEEAFRNELTHNHFAKYMVMELAGHIIGYAGMWAIVDEAHVTNIALLEAYRGRKWGERLLEELMKTASYVGMKSITLEVRVSNEVAQNLYRKKAFDLLAHAKDIIPIIARMRSLCGRICQSTRSMGIWKEAWT